MTKYMQTHTFKLIEAVAEQRHMALAARIPFITEA